MSPADEAAVERIRADDDLLKRFQNVRLISLDVDGVQTDGSLYYMEGGEEIRKFNVRDGYGIKATMRTGFLTAIITSSTTCSIRHRAARLAINYVRVGAENKLETIHEICREASVGLNEVAHIADDLNDLEIMNAVGCPVAVADAVPAILEAACYVTSRGGGHGAVREFCDLIIEVTTSTLRPHRSQQPKELVARTQ